jgi:hypothetical protein
MRARQEDLRAARLRGARRRCSSGRGRRREGFARDLLVAADHAFGAAEVDDDVAVFDALDDAVDDLADAVLEFLVLALALGFAHLLQDDLLGRLRGDAAQVDRRQRHRRRSPVCGIELGADIVLRAVAVARRATGASLDRECLFSAIADLDDDRLVDHLLAGDAVRNREQFGACWRKSALAMACRCRVS